MNKIYHDNKARLITINDYTLHPPFHVNTLIRTNQWDTNWEQFKFSEFRATDYKLLMSLYRDCGVNWLEFIHFTNKEDQITCRGKIVLGQLAQNCCIFFLSYHLKVVSLTIQKPTVDKHEIELHYPKNENDWDKLLLKDIKSPAKIKSWRSYLKKQWDENYDQLSSDTIAKISKILIDDL